MIRKTGKKKEKWEKKKKNNGKWKMRRERETEYIAGKNKIRARRNMGKK